MRLKLFLIRERQEQLSVFLQSMMRCQRLDMAAVTI